MRGTKRKSTVHDFSSLRLHPDGTRVVGESSSRSLRNARFAVQDHRGNWIARDAAGLGQVKKRWSMRAAKDEHEAQDDESGEEGSTRGSLGIDKGKRRARNDADMHEEEEGEDDVKDPRAIRRKLFTDDLNFLRSSPTSAATTGAYEVRPDNVPAIDAEGLPLNPTSDLLKSIHYFASTYYSEMGQLRDSSRGFRREKKRRRIERLKAEEADADISMSAEGSPACGQVHPQDGNSCENSDSDNVETSEEGVQEADGAKRHRTRGPRQRNSHTRADMYKIFDGSALMAIGMLVQEYVSKEVSTRIPEGWEDEMLRVEELDARSTHRVGWKGNRERRTYSKGSSSDGEAQTTDGDDTDTQMYIPSDSNETHGESLPE